MSILALPAEIIIIIRETCSSLRDLNAFSQANCQLFNILNKYLYRRDFSVCEHAFGIAVLKDNELAVRRIIREAKGRRLPFSKAVKDALGYYKNKALMILVEAILESDFLNEFLEILPEMLQRLSRHAYVGRLVHQVKLLFPIFHSLDLSQRPKLSSDLLDWVIDVRSTECAGVLIKNGAQMCDLHYRRFFRSSNTGDVDGGSTRTMTELFLNMCPDSALSPTTFSAAVKAGRLSAVMVLVLGGADLKVLDTNGHPPLWHTTDSDMINYLSLYGASPNAVSADGETVVDHAIENSCYEAVETLVDCGADFLRVKLQNCKKLLCHSISRKNFEILQQIIPQHLEILSDKSVIESLRRIFCKGICDDEPFKKMLGHLRWFGAHRQSNATSLVNLFDRSLVSLIPTDVGSSVLLVRHLLVYGANSNVYISGHGSALEAVAKGQRDECVKYLIEHGLNLDKFDHAYLERIQQLAVASGNSTVVQLLLNKGIDPDFNQKRTECGSEALIWEPI
jgi:ankyrin repeat protein